ncbi:MAG: hypothetical protein L3J91_04910 [Thermoplasmata archaeon]|nr:hypothetical protein [Thermoplasmata archaeon]
MLTHSSAGIQALLFALFAALTGVLSAIIGPTYDDLLVPELGAGSLYPSLSADGGGSFLNLAASLSTYVLVNVVDPALALVGLAVGVAYLGRAFLGRWSGAAEPLLGRLVLAVVLANFSLPIGGAVLGLAGATYPVIAGFDGGAWRHWSSLDGTGGIAFSWDNGALAFVVTFTMFSVVMLLAVAVALRDAMLAVLLVLLPMFTLLWPIPPLAPLARRAWLMFGELAFLPCVMIIPLELAVGSRSVLLLLGFLTVALASPALVSLAGAQLTQAGFPSAGGVVANGMQRGLAVASSASENLVRPAGMLVKASPAASQLVGSAGRALGGSTFPAAGPLLAADVLGRGSAHLFQHLAKHGPPVLAPDRFPSVGTSSGGGTDG